MSIGEAVEEQVEAKAAVPWLQHTTYDYDNQQATPLFPGAPNELSGDKLTNGIGANDHQSMEVDDEDDIGFSLDQLLNIPKTSDIGQVNLCVFELMCNFSFFSFSSKWKEEHNTWGEFVVQIFFLNYCLLLLLFCEYDG